MKCNKSFLILVSFTAWLGFTLFSCSSDELEPQKSTTPYGFPDIMGFPTMLNIPVDNPTTVEGVELGRYLFYDGRLSGRLDVDSLMSCGSCHLQAKGFEFSTNIPRFSGGFPVGIPDQQYPEGKPTAHVTLPLVNLVYNHNGYLWNGLLNKSNTDLGSPSLGVPPLPEFHLRNLESVVWLAIAAPEEINGSISKTVETISNIPRYPPMFEKAFGTEEVTYDRISKAIAQFVRTIISYRSKFHRYLRGEAELTSSEYSGFELFFSEEADCFHCHGGSVLMTTNLYYNNAKDTVFSDPFDRYGITGMSSDIGAYKAPSLINIAVRSPYMHDGRFKSLEEVIDFYSDGLVYSDYVHPLMKNVHTGGVRLTDQEKADLKAFLETLTDHELLSDPQFARPNDL